MVHGEKTEDAESLARLYSFNRRDSAARRSMGSPLAMFASAVSDGVGATMGAWERVFRRPSTSDAYFRCVMEGGHGILRELLPV